jgi:hypothetical protein
MCRVTASELCMKILKIQRKNESNIRMEAEFVQMTQKVLEPLLN